MMVGGRARTIGSPLALKNRYGAGWTIDIDSASSVKAFFFAVEQKKLVILICSWCNFLFCLCVFVFGKSISGIVRRVATNGAVGNDSAIAAVIGDVVGARVDV